MRDRPHWSYSALAQFLRCPLQFYFQRIAKLPQPFTPSGLALGSCVHKAIALYHRSIKEDFDLMPNAVQDEFLGAWRERRSHERIQFQGPESDLLQQGIGLLEAYLSEPPPEEVLEVETELMSPIHDSQGEYLEMPLLSVIDLLARENEDLVVVDFKTSSRAYSEMDAETSLQATCYLNAVNENYGADARFEYTVLVKTKKPKVQHLEVTRMQEDFSRLGDLVRNVERAIAAGAFYPVESPLNCSSCPFRQPCREWQGQPHQEELIPSIGILQREEVA